MFYFYLLGQIKVHEKFTGNSSAVLKLKVEYKSKSPILNLNADRYLKNAPHSVCEQFIH